MKILSLIILALIIPFNARAYVSGGCEYIHIEPVKIITIQNLNRLTAKKIFPGSNGSFVYWPFDSEDHPSNKYGKAAALILASQGDIGEEPFGAIVWSKYDVKVAPVSKEQSDGAYIDIIPSQNQKLCQNPHFILKLAQDGSVLANGNKVGNIK